jgi:hypothetical protein
MFVGEWGMESERDRWSPFKETYAGVHVGPRLLASLVNDM